MNTLQLNKRITGGNNALNILQNVASLGSTIRNNSDVSNSGMMTGQELADRAAKQDSQTASGVVSTIMAVIGTVLACL